MTLPIKTKKSLLADSTLLKSIGLSSVTKYSNILIQNSQNLYNLSQIKTNSDKYYYLQKLVASQQGVINWFNIFQVAVKEHEQKEAKGQSSIISLMDVMDRDDGCYVDSDDIIQKTQSNVINILNYKQCQLILPLLFSTIRLCHWDFPHNLTSNACNSSCITSLVQDNQREQLYFWNQFCDFSIFFRIDIENKIVTDVRDLTPKFTNFLKNESIDRYNLLAMEPKGNECHLLIEYKKHIYHISKSFDSNEFKMNHILDDSCIGGMNVEYTLISSASALYQCETILCGNCSTDDEQMHYMNLKRYNKQGNWLSFANIQSKYCLHFDCCVLVKGNYGVLFRSDCIYIIDYKKGTLTQIEDISLLSDNGNSIGQYFAILQADSEQESALKIGGFVRKIIQSTSSFIRYPPQYLLQLIEMYHCKETIFLLRQSNGEYPYIQEPNGDYNYWELNVDDIFNETIV